MLPTLVFTCKTGHSLKLCKCYTKKSPKPTKLQCNLPSLKLKIKKKSCPKATPQPQISVSHKTLAPYFTTPYIHNTIIITNHNKLQIYSHIHKTTLQIPNQSPSLFTQTHIYV